VFIDGRCEDQGEGEGSRRPLRRESGPPQRDNRCGWCVRRALDDHRRGGEARGWEGPREDGGNGGAAGEGKARARFRGLVLPERERGDDRDGVGGGVRVP